MPVVVRPIEKDEVSAVVAPAASVQRGPGLVDQEQTVIADVDLNLLDEQRANGTVLPRPDKDAYLFSTGVSRGNS
jgi:hypothetical protein